ncbi:hypothetical protein ACLIYM_25100 [Streptomyces fenghuangensis]
MALPGSIPTVTVTGRYLGLDGNPLQGTITWEAPAAVTVADADVILSGPVSVPLTEGTFSITLPATDAPGMNPSGWTYTVTEQLGRAGTRTYRVLLPSETPLVDIADIAPTDPATPDYVAVHGDSAYEVAVTNGFVGTEAEWLASLVGPTGPAGSVDTVNGHAGPDVVLAAADVGAIPATEKAAPDGVATLDTSGTVPVEQLPAAASSRSVVIAAPAVGSYAIWQADQPCTVTGVCAYRAGGTGATINAAVNAADLLATDLSLATADSWLTGPDLQNTAVAAGDSLSVAVRSVAGSPSALTIQIDVEEA